MHIIYAIARLNILASGSEILRLGEECYHILFEKAERSDTTNLQSKIVNIHFRLVRVRDIKDMYELKVVTRFAAAHQLTMVGAKCENMHGHNWKIEVYVTGENLDKAGVLMDFGVIKKHVADVMDMLDHKYLNELPAFESKQPSSENIAYLIAAELQQRIDDSAATVSRVTAWESEDAGATYILPKP